MTLAEKMTTPEKRPQIVTECVTLVDEEVKSKGGISGLAVKAAYGVVKAVKPRFVTEVVDSMLDEWIAKLEPFYAEWHADGEKLPLPDALKARGSELAERLLEVTDGRAKNAKNASVKKMYQRMRPSAKKHVEDAVPRLGRLVERQVTA